MDPRGVEAYLTPVVGLLVNCFRWTLVGLKLAIIDEVAQELSGFQMDPRGVEAPSARSSRIDSSGFQMDPRGVEALLASSADVRGLCFRWTLVGLKQRRKDTAYHRRQQFQMDPRGVEATTPEPSRSG